MNSGWGPGLRLSVKPAIGLANMFLIPPFLSASRNDAIGAAKAACAASMLYAYGFILIAVGCET